MDIVSIGKVHNHASEENMEILPLWKQAISGIEITGSEYLLFTEYHSHYIVIHDPLKIKFPQRREELNKRFCSAMGASIVSYIRKEGSVHYVRGLIAENNASIYSILPYTSFDRIEEAQFPQSNMEARKMKALSNILPVLHGKNILDVGCGLGTLTIKIANAKPDALIHGIDLLDSVIEQCRFNARVEGTTNTKFIAASAYDIPFEKGYFDAVTCFFMLHHLDDIPRALNDIKRVLKPTGEVFAVEPIDHFHDVQRNPEDWKELFLEAGYKVEVWEKDKVSYIRAVLQ